MEVDHHPTSVENEDWFFDSISVDDNAGTIYTFPCYNWLSSIKGDGHEARILFKGKATQRKYLVSGSYERTKLTRTHAFLFLFLKVKGHIIVSHARRLGTIGSILNLRCFPNSKTADSFTERERI